MLGTYNRRTRIAAGPAICFRGGYALYFALV
jgi:hypothetical protein